MSDREVPSGWKGGPDPGGAGQAIASDLIYGMQVVRPNIWDCPPFLLEDGGPAHEHRYATVHILDGHGTSYQVCTCGHTVGCEGLAALAFPPAFPPVWYAADRDRWPLTDNPQAQAALYGTWALRVAAALGALAVVPLLWNLLVRLLWFAP